MAQGTPLPRLDSPLVQRLADEDPNYISAYIVCLDFELQHARSPGKLRHTRILGYLLLYAPTRAARHEVAGCIHSRKDVSDLVDIGAFFERNVILIFKKFKGRTPRTSQRPSRPASFEGEKDWIEVDIKQAPRDHKEAKGQALVRDGFACVVTGLVDERAPKEVKSRPRPPGSIDTQCAHIIPESTYFNLEPKTKENSKLDYSASILPVLKQFHYDIESFNGEKVHSLTNVMTMQSDVHNRFDKLQLYLEATEWPTTYEIKWTTEEAPPHVRKTITFSTPDPARLPIPSRELLTLHATCCKVAHLSGSAEYIDDSFRDADEMGVLSTDDASTHTLDFLLALLKPEHAQLDSPMDSTGPELVTL